MPYSLLDGVSQYNQQPQGMRREGEFFTILSYGLQDTVKCDEFLGASVVVTYVNSFRLFQVNICLK